MLVFWSAGWWGMPVIAPSLCSCPARIVCTQSPKTQSWLRWSYVDGVASSAKAHPWYWCGWSTGRSCHVPWPWHWWLICQFSCGSRGIQPAFHSGSSSCWVSLSAHSGGIGLWPGHGAICTSTLCAWVWLGLRRWDIAWACLVLDGGWHLGPKLFWQGLDLLVLHMPIQSCEEMLVALSLCQHGDPMAPGFKQQSFFDLPPRVLDADLIVQHEVGCGPGKSVEIVDLPFPLGHIGNGKRSFHSVPWMSLVRQLLVDLLPGLFQVWKLVSWALMWCMMT